MKTTRFSKVMITLLVCFLIFGSFPPNVHASTVTFNRQQRIEARKARQAGKAAFSNSQKSKPIPALGASEKDQLEGLKPLYAPALQESYNNSLHLQKMFDSTVPLFTGIQSMQLFQISSQYADKLSEYKVYLDKAKFSPSSFELSDFKTALTIGSVLSVIADRFNALTRAFISSNSHE